MILCCGEALIDMIPGGPDPGINGFVPHPGGAVFNTARALGRLGAKVGLFSGLSHDMFGDMLKSALSQSNVDTQLVAFSDRPTTLAFVTLNNGDARYSFFDENSAGRMLTLQDLPHVGPQTDVLFFGGISLAVEPAADAYAALAAQESPAKLIMLDPNIRPSFITDEPAYRTRLARLMAHCDIVKVSNEDLAWLCPGADHPEAKAESLLACGPKLVLLTKGRAGAMAFMPKQVTATVPARPVTVTDTVGAGDAFNAGFLSQLSTLGYADKSRFATLPQEALKTCLTFAATVAAHTVTRVGADPPWRKEL